MNTKNRVFLTKLTPEIRKQLDIDATYKEVKVMVFDSNDNLRANLLSITAQMALNNASEIDTLYTALFGEISKRRIRNEFTTRYNDFLRSNKAKTLFKDSLMAEVVEYSTTKAEYFPDEIVTAPFEHEYISFKALDNAFSEIFNNIFTEMLKDYTKKPIEELKKIPKLETELKNKEFKINQLQAELKRTKESLKNQLEDTYSKQIEALTEENRLLAKQLKGQEKLVMQIKSNSISGNETGKAIELPEPDTVDEELKQIILESKYLFIGFKEFAKNRNAILNKFVNSDYEDRTGTPVLSHVMSYEAVVCLTKQVEHPTYFAYRNMCKKNNIEFIHCDTNNVDRIVELIANHSKIEREE